MHPLSRIRRIHEDRATLPAADEHDAMKKVLLGLLPLVGLVLLLEGVLWVGGWGESGVRLSMSRGFDRDAAYIVPDPQVPGGWVTQMFDKPALEVRVPPRTAKLRLVMVGGSNVQGFPADVLQQALTARVPHPGWEVFNLGRSGYGSERVSILLDQALELLKPDVVLIYSGHNEFMERGFAQELEAEGALGWMGDVAETLMGLRTMNLAMDLAAPRRVAVDFARAPEPRQEGRDAAFIDIDYATTKVYYEAYRIHVEQMCRASLRHGAAVVLCTIVGNDFSPPYQAAFGPQVDAATETRYMQARGVALELLPERFKAGLYPPVRLSQPEWGLTLAEPLLAARLADPPAGRRRVPRLRDLLGPLGPTPATRAYKAESVAGAHWSDPRLWLPSVYTVLDSMQAIHERQLTPDERRALVQARQALEHALQIVPDHPFALFDLGLVSYLLGDDAAARRFLVASTDFDRAPRRGADLVNGLIRSVKDEVKRIELYDADAFFRQNSPGGLLSYEALTDVCHLQPGVRPVLMRELAPVVLKAVADMRGPR